MKEPFRIINIAVLIVAFATTLTSCSIRDPYLVEGIGADGVREVVSIAPEPLPAPWRLIEDLRIGIDYGEEGEMLRWPRNFIIMEDGTHVVLDDRPLQIRIFDADGVFIRAFGEQGQGPADFLRYIDQRNLLLATEPEQFELWTGWPLRRQTWDTSGRLHSVVSLGSDHPWMDRRVPAAIRVFDKTLFALAITTIDPQPEYRERLVHVLRSDWSGTGTDSLGVYHHEMMPIELGVFWEGTGMGAFDQLLVTSSGRLFITTFDQDWVRELNPATGEELVRFRWEHEPDTYTGARLEERWGPDTDRRVADALVWFEERVSLMYIGEGPDEEIWVQRTVKNIFQPGQANLIMPDPENIIPTDVFSSSGAYRGRMELPFEARTQKLFGEYLYAISRTTGGAPVLIRYRLEAVR